MISKFRGRDQPISFLLSNRNLCRAGDRRRLRVDPQQAVKVGSQFIQRSGKLIAVVLA